MSKVDLHIHSEFSDDGELPVSRILDMCKSTGMKLIAITDHNSVKSVNDVKEIIGTGKNGETRVIPGVELDCFYRDINFHLLGYGIDHTRKEFAEIDADIRNQEKEAGEKRIILFQKATGIPLDAAAILNAANGGIVTGELIGQHLLAKENAADYDVLKPYLPGGVKSDMPFVRIYWDFFAPEKPGYVHVHYIPLQEAIKLIHSSQGIAVVAHPGQTIAGDYTLLNDVIAEGIDGLEVYSSYHSAGDAERFLDITRQNKLLATSGSDFHGKTKPNIRFGGHGAMLDDDELIRSFNLKLGQLSV